MRVSYDKDKWSRVGAWQDLLKRRPAYTYNNHLFKPDDRHFRKDHNQDEWAWFVAKWHYLGVVRDGIVTRSSEIPQTAVALSPPPVVLSCGSVVNYVWSTWSEYDGTKTCGFVEAFSI